MHEGATIVPLRTQTFIKRPRLTKLLDESGARIILLLAPAGYGKTTLAHEWTDEQANVGWYTGAPAMIDVAGLSVGIAEVLGRMGEIPRPDMVERVRILAAHGHDPRGLAKAVSGGAPGPDSILVVDDYHHALGSADAEAFVEELVSLTEFRLLITSRDRPSWLPARKVVYGEAAVVEMDALAFTDEEALAVLGETGGGILADARGWPAVIGLAAMRGGAAMAASGLQGHELYEFFAEDLLRSSSPQLQDAMFLLALAGVDAARALLGARHQELVAAAAERGFLAGADRKVVHPLLRGFLLTKLRDLDDAKRDGFVARAIEYLAAQHRWDDCLFVLERFPDDELILSTLERGLAEMLDLGLVASVRRWVTLAEHRRLRGALFMLAEAEVALREGDSLKALALGERAGDELTNELSARSYLAAGRAAHLGDKPEDARRLVERAMTMSTSNTTRLDALWTLCMSQIEEVGTDLTAVLTQLENVGLTGPTHAARVSSARAMVSARRGDVRAATKHLEVAAEFTPRVNDPFVRTNVLHHLSYVYGLSARYADSLALVDEALRESRATGLRFVEGHGLLLQAASLIGRREFRRAQSVLDSLDRHADHFIQTNVDLRRARLAAAIGDLDRALALLRPYAARRDLRPAFHGEVRAYAAIICASSMDTARAKCFLDEDEGQFEFVESHALECIARSIINVYSGTSPVALLRTVFESGVLDAIVTGYRACPDLLVACRDSDLHEELVTLLARSHDFDIARTAGISIPREARPRERLSPRERDVYELLIQGRSNIEIAKALFISESTTKVHVRHIFEKLGVRSRAEAAAVAYAARPET